MPAAIGSVSQHSATRSQRADSLSVRFERAPVCFAICDNDVYDAFRWAGAAGRETTMNQGQIAADTSWSAMTSLSADERERRMTDILREVAGMPESERVDRLEGLVRAEYELDDQTLRPFTATRLRALLAINREDHDAANNLARGWDTVFDRLPGGLAMRRATVVQTVARKELSADEVGELFELVPSLVRSVPRAKTEAMHIERKGKALQRDEANTARMEIAAAGGDASVRPWWKFWER
jgi:hypothetical protein